MLTLCTRIAMGMLSYSTAAIPHFRIWKPNIMKQAQVKTMGKPNIFTITHKKSSPQSSHYRRDAFRLLHHFMCGCLHSLILMYQFNNLLICKLCHANLFQIAQLYSTTPKVNLFFICSEGTGDTSQYIQLHGHTIRASPHGTMKSTG